MTEPTKDIQSAALLSGDLSKLTPEQRLEHYMDVCASLGLNPLTRPFEYQVFQGKTILYARKDCAEQLRRRDSISITIVSRDVIEGLYVVTARATTTTRCDESTGAISIQGLSGEAKANAFMKAETKAKRRVTLSIAGLGILDESDIGPDGPSDVPSPGVTPLVQPGKDEAVLAKLKQTSLAPAPTPEPPAPDPVPPVGDEGGEPAFIWNIAGKHKGESVVTMDYGYLKWYVDNGTNVEHVKVAVDELTRRQGLFKDVRS